jgi:AcrR family transcriptional regulator
VTDSSQAVRRTQAERSASTRKRIIDATIECLVEKGHGGTTTLEVQGRAKVSRGALLYHFPSRAELLVGAIDHLIEAQRRELAGVLATRGPLPLDGAIDTLWSGFNSFLATAAAELWSAARTDVELRALLARHDRALNREVRELCTELFGSSSRHLNFDLTLATLIDAMHGAARASVVRSDRAMAARVAGWKQLAHVLLS